MVLVFRTIIDLLRERLLQLRRQAAADRHSGWKFLLEIRVVRYLLHRHADADYAEPPHAAEALDAESAQKARGVFLNDEARERLGLPVVRNSEPVILLPIAPQPEHAVPRSLTGKKLPTACPGQTLKEDGKLFGDPEKERAWQKLFGGKSRHDRARS